MHILFIHLLSYSKNIWPNVNTAQYLKNVQWKNVAMNDQILSNFRFVKFKSFV